MSNETDELRKEIGSLLSRLESLEAKEKKMWVAPKGKYYINGCGEIRKQSMYDDYTKYGSTRNTEAELKDLRQKQEFLNISHNFACANDGVQEFVVGQHNWCVIKMDGKIRSNFYSRVQHQATVYMTEKDAKEFARLCEANLIPFQYQE